MTDALKRPPPPTPEEPLALTKPVAAAKIGCSERYLELEAAAGRLKILKLGRKWLVRPSDLSDWLDAKASR
jgi:excisionase family DNA binding protein